MATLTIVSPPVLLNARTTATGAFAFTLSGTSGLVYVIEVATNLQQWASMSLLTNLTGKADVTDPSCSNSPARFYRARIAD